MSHPEKPFASFAAHGKRFSHDVVGRFAVFQPLFEAFGLLHQLLVGQRLVGRFKRINRVDFGLQTADVAGVGRTKQVGNQSLKTGK